VGAAVDRRRWEFGEEDRCDDECDAVAEVAADQGPATAEAVDEEDAEELGDERDDGVDGLVAQGGFAGDANLLVDVDGVVSVWELDWASRGIEWEE
jgi:hypothetical protein